MSANPPADWFREWVIAHGRATAADPSAGVALMSNRAIIVGEPWLATELELHECTRRLVAKRATPKFPNEHVDAVGLELIELRKERTRPTLPAASSEASCPICSGTGEAIGVHPGCVWGGRVVKHRECGRVMSCAVLCDQCEIGRRLITLNRAKDNKQWRMTLDKYYRVLNGLDGVELLKEYEQEQARLGRAGMTEAQRLADFKKKYPRLSAQVFAT